MYDHRNKTSYSLAECEAAVGKRATLCLTGVIDSARESPTGPYVRLLLDERWGFGIETISLDLDALRIKEEE